MLVMGLWLGKDRFGGMFCILAYGRFRAIGPLFVSLIPSKRGRLRGNGDGSAAEHPQAEMGVKMEIDTYVSLDPGSRRSCPFDHVEKGVVSWYQSLLLPL